VYDAFEIVAMTENDETVTKSDSTESTPEVKNQEIKKEDRSAPAVVRIDRGKLLSGVSAAQLKTKLPEFRAGDSIRVHTKIREGTKERVQIFEGVVIRRHKGTQANATFTVRKISYNIGVERTFMLHSPRIEKIEVVSRGEVRRARLFYIRELRGKAARIRSQLVSNQGLDSAEVMVADDAVEDAAEESPSKKKVKKVDAGVVAEAHA